MKKQAACFCKLDSILDNFSVNNILPLIIEESKIEILKKKKKRKVYFTTQEWADARKDVFDRDGKICYVCGSTATQVDHLLPKSKFPHLALDRNNLKPICWLCNRAKNAKVLHIHLHIDSNGL